MRWPQSAGASARMWVGWFMKVRASVMIGSGMVAENSIACRSVGDLLEDALDVGQEAEVEHFVGLVEHQYRQAAELQVALLRQVEQAARRADDDVDSLVQRLDLRLVRAGHRRST